VTQVLVVDYGVGNLLSVRRALERCGGEVELSADPGRVRECGHLVLPGVGAFGDCVARLRERQLIEPLRDRAADGRPFLGICVGMQMLFEASEEFGLEEGLGLLAGRVERLPETAADGTPHKVPHVAWAPLVPGPQAGGFAGTVLQDVEPRQCCYFLHSYGAVPADTAVRIADTLYDGRRIAAVVGMGNLIGCQFHPEKSGEVGLRILARFLSNQPATMQRCTPVGGSWG
jgi:glutamine amidotransferase